MYVRLLLPFVSSLVLAQPRAEAAVTLLPSAPAGAPGSFQKDEAWFSESPVDEAFAAIDEKRFADAAKALGKAGDDAMANYLLGCMYRYGSLGEPNIAKAKAALEIAARGNCADAALDLANMAFNDKDQAGVDRWLKRAYVLDVSTAALDLAKFYAPPGTTAQPERAIAWARIAKADKVDGADRLVRELLSSHPADASRGELLRVRLAAELAAGRKSVKGVVQIQMPMEMFLPKGAARPGGGASQPAFDKANASYKAREFEAALRGFTPLAEAGNAAAAFYVGRILEQGFTGQADPVAALRWYRQAAAEGIDAALGNLGFMTLEGRGAPKDPKVATDFLLHAAYAGNLDGAVNIGFAYGTGQGRKKDLVEAAAWYSIAADFGAEAGRKNLSIIEGKMSSVDKVSAKSRRRDIELELRGDAQPKYPLPRLNLGQTGGGQRVSGQINPSRPIRGGDSWASGDAPAVRPIDVAGPVAGESSLEDAMRAFDKGDEAEAIRILQVHAGQGMPRR